MRIRKMLVAGAVLGIIALVGQGCSKRPPEESQDADIRQGQGGPGEKAPFAFERGVKVQAAGKPIDVVVGHLVPCVVDWNNDGRKDLLVGQFSNGAIRLYLNSGTDTAPVFGESVFLEAGGKPIKLDAG